MYSFIGKKTGRVLFHGNNNGTITKESLSLTGKVTSNPVEDGTTVDDHIVLDPNKLSVSGIIVGGQSAAKRLQAMRDKRDLVIYNGSTRQNNMAFTSLNINWDSDNKNGCSFSVVLQHVKISSAEYVQMGEKPMMSQQDKGASNLPQNQTAPTRQEGLQTTVIESISTSAYADYTNSFNTKQTASDGPSSRATPSYSG